MLAGDTRVTADGTIITNAQRKVHRLRDGRLFGWAGAVEDAERLRLTLLRGLAPPDLSNISALMIHTDGAIDLYEGSMWVRQQEGYCAVGSGAAYALAAMDAGASAVEAVNIGIKRDMQSGGKVKKVKLGKKK